MIANVNRDAKKKPQPYKPADFMPKWDAERESRQPASADSLKRKLEMFAASAGAERG